jgi:signal transduction histidine kinase/CheY-like chemotaxis protein
MYRTDRPGFGADIGISPNAVAVVMIGAGCLLAAWGESSGLASRMYVVALALIVLTVAGWWLDSRQSPIGRWLLVTVAALATMLGCSWLHMPGLFAALVLPPLLAGALMGLHAIWLTAAVETLALWSLAAGGVSIAISMTTAAQASFSIWAVVAVVYGVTGSAGKLLVWLWEYFSRSQTALEEARDQRAELQQALANLEYATRQLALANERLAALHEVAEEAQRSKSAFVAKVSHEFRTPLNIIIGLAGLLVESPEMEGRSLPPTVVEDLKTIWRNCSHLSGLVNDVLDLSQAEAERLTLQREWVDLGEIIDSAMAVVNPLVQKKGLKLQVDVQPDVPRVYCDRNRMRQVILNLVSNAARFTDTGGITVRMACHGGMVCVSVADTGPGIAPEDRQRIFEPFCQGTDRLWRDRGGSGLGLTISRQFIELHQGRIWLESELGRGSTLTFEIPIAPDTSAAGVPQRWIVEDWQWYDRSGATELPDLSVKPRVVLHDAAGGLCTLLARDAGDAIDVMEVGELPQSAGDAHPFPGHVLLLNVTEPEGMWSAVAAARPAAPDTPIIACCVPTQRYAMEQAGVAAYLIKPILRENLLGAIRRLPNRVRRILIADDDPDMQDILARMLATGGDWEVAAVGTGAAALERLRTDPSDLLLLDLLMPEMDGREVLRCKAQEPAIRGIPVIVISAQDPFEQASLTQGVLATAGQGVPVGRLLQLSLTISKLLLGAGG